MLKEDLIVGHVYAAKKPTVTIYGFFNDRQILYVGKTNVQYDSPTVTNGQHYPTVSIEKFLLWAGKDITAIMPKTSWREKDE